MYETGKVRYVSAKTRGWTKAEERMRKMMDERDPVRIALREIEDRERRKCAPPRRCERVGGLDVPPSLTEEIRFPPIS